MKPHRKLLATLQRLLGPASAEQRLTAELADLNAEPFATNPFPLYESLRRSGPVVFLPKNACWIVLGHAEAREILQDPQRFSSSPYRAIDAALAGADPPRHTIVRQLLAPVFATEVLDRLSAFAEQRAQQLLKPTLEVVTEYSRPLSRAIGAELIGFDAADTAKLFAAAEASHATEQPFIAQFAAVDVIASRSRFYRDLMERGNGMLSLEEVASLTRLMWVASTFTTERLITASILRLLCHEPQRRDVLAEPRLLPAFMDETARLHPPEPMLLRAVTERVTMGRVTIPAGGSVRVCVAAANRDPRRFEGAHEFNLQRKGNRHLAFGAGAHHCIGIALTRRLLPVAMGTLLRAMPNLRATAPLESMLATQFTSRLEITQ